MPANSSTYDQWAELHKRMRETVAALPKKVGTLTVNFALDNFKRQGFLGSTLQPWRPRKKVNKKNRGRNILTLSGRGRRSIRILWASLDEVVVGSDLPYMKAHNEGFRGTVTVKAHSRMKMTTERVGTGSFTKKGKERTKTVSKMAGSYPVKSFQRKMNLPKRPFLAESPYLEAPIKRLIAADVLKAARNF